MLSNILDVLGPTLSSGVFDSESSPRADGWSPGRRFALSTADSCLGTPASKQFGGGMAAAPRVSSVWRQRAVGFSGIASGTVLGVETGFSWPLGNVEEDGNLLRRVDRSVTMNGDPAGMNSGLETSRVGEYSNGFIPGAGGRSAAEPGDVRFDSPGQGAAARNGDIKGPLMRPGREGGAEEMQL